MNKLRIITLVVSLATVIVPSIFYLMASYFLPVIPFLGGMLLFYFCLSKKNATLNFYFFILGINLFLWIIPIAALIGYANIVGG